MLCYDPNHDQTSSNAVPYWIGKTRRVREQNQHDLHSSAQCDVRTGWCSHIWRTRRWSGSLAGHNGWQRTRHWSGSTVGVGKVMSLYTRHVMNKLRGPIRHRGGVRSRRSGHPVAIVDVTGRWLISRQHRRQTCCPRWSAAPVGSAVPVPLLAASTRRNLCSAGQGDLLASRTKTVSFGPRSFAIAGP